MDVYLEAEEFCSVIPEQQYDSVATYVRIRPPSSVRENSTQEICQVQSDGDNHGTAVCILDPAFFDRKSDYDQKYFERSFKYDFCFSQEANQQAVYERVAEPLLKHALDGYNCSLMTYGQTGSGKTYTMMGEDTKAWGVESSSEEFAGVIPRLCKGLLEEIDKKRIHTNYSTVELHEGNVGDSNNQKDLKLSNFIHDASVYCSFYEIYVEKVHDLLSKNPERVCRVREHPDSGAYVEKLTKLPIKTISEVGKIVSLGIRNRTVAETKMNAMSSRSHAIFSLFIEQTVSSSANIFEKDRFATSNNKVQRQSKIIMVDLAGSERVSFTGATGDRLIEANNINKSLSTLSDVIKALSDKGAAIQREVAAFSEGVGVESIEKLKSDITTHYYVPYRNSVLTWLLKDCLGGNARTSILANISPIEKNYNETMSTLRYVERAKLIVTSATVNETSNDPAFVIHLQRQITQLQKNILNFNKEKAMRDAEYRADIQVLEESLENEFVRRTADMKEELIYYQNCSNSPTKTHESSPFQQSTSQNESATENFVLLAEIERLNSLVHEKEFIIDQYEQKDFFSASQNSLETIDSPRSSSRLKGIVLAYKKEKNIMYKQYEDLLRKCRALGEDLDNTRAYITNIEKNKVHQHADLQLARADRSRLKNEVASRTEEVHTKESELNFYKAKFASIQVEYARKMKMLEINLKKAKESEFSLNRQRQLDQDRFRTILQQNEDSILNFNVTLKEKVDRIGTLEEGMISLQIQEKQKEREVEEEKQNVAKLSKEVEDERKHEHELEDRINVEEAEIAQLQKNLSATQAEIVDVKERFDAVKKESHDRLMQEEKRSKALEDTCAEMNIQNDDLKATLKEKVDRIGTLEEGMISLQIQEKQKEREVNQKAKELKDLEEEVEEEINMIEALEVEHEKEEKLSEMYAKSIEDKDKKIVFLEEKVLDGDSMIKQLIKKHENEKLSKRHEVNSGSTAASTIRSQIHSESTLQIANDHFLLNSDAILELRDTLELSEAAREELATQIPELQRDNSELNAKLMATEQDIINQREEKVKTEIVLQEEINKLKFCVDQLNQAMLNKEKDHADVIAQGVAKGWHRIKEISGVTNMMEHEDHTHDEKSLASELIKTKMELALNKADLETVQHKLSQAIREIEELREFSSILREQLETK